MLDRIPRSVACGDPLSLEAPTAHRLKTIREALDEEIRSKSDLLRTRFVEVGIIKSAALYLPFRGGAR